MRTRSFAIFGLLTLALCFVPGAMAEEEAASTDAENLLAWLDAGDAPLNGELRTVAKLVSPTRRAARSGSTSNCPPMHRH